VKLYGIPPPFGGINGGISAYVRIDTPNLGSK